MFQPCQLSHLFVVVLATQLLLLSHPAGQHVQSDGSLKLPRGGVRLTLWNRAASSGHSFWQNLYGSHPFFLQVQQGRGQLQFWCDC
jgi:hypothetical protein